MEANRAVANNAGDKTTSMGLDWPHTEETRWMRCQEGDLGTPGGARECQSWRREDLHGMRQKTLYKVGQMASLSGRPMFHQE